MADGAERGEAAARAGAEGDPREREPLDIEFEASAAEPEPARGEPSEDTDGADAATDGRAAALELAGLLERAEAERDKSQSQYRYLYAEFDTYKRRNAAARAESREEGVREAVGALLPAIDSLELAAAYVGEAGEGALSEGIRKVLKTAADALGRLGVEELPALDTPFDPEIHESVRRMPGETPGNVVEVYRKGYRYKGRVIRYAQVAVAADEDE